MIVLAIDTAGTGCFAAVYDSDIDTVLASAGPMAVTAEEIWSYEERATAIALAFDFYPDGWELAEKGA